MALKVEPVAVGEPARDALLRAVAAAKVPDPFAPVTVVVPSNLAALAVRRALGAARWPGGAAGIVAVDVLTPVGLAQRILGPSGGGPPLTSAVLSAAARAALAADAEAGGFFAPVAAHPATEQAVVRLYAELRRVAPASLDVLARSASPRTRAVVALHRDIRARVAGHLDEHDLLAAAVDAVREGLDVSSVGTVVVHLLDDVAPAATLLAELSTIVDVVVLHGRTGVATADEPADRALARLLPPGATVPDGPAVEPPRAGRVVTASDSDDEVRAVVRAILERAESGVPFERMGVFYPLDDPYARIVHERLDAAGVPHTGPSVHRLADTLVGRTLLRVLALVPGTFRRHEVVDLICTAPVRRPGGGPVPATAWDRLSRRAGVVGGLDDWRRKLDAHRLALGARLTGTSADELSEGARQRIEAEARHAEQLHAFVEWLAASVEAAGAASTWREHAERARRLVHDLLGPVPARHWPDAEQRAATRVLDVLSSLSVLDRVDPNPSAARFADAVAAELDRPANRIGRAGVGVVYGPLSHAAGLDLDVVFVVGMAEGLCPATHRDDSLLPDAERRKLPPGELREHADTTARQHRSLLVALAAGRERVLTVPRGDHRSGRTRLASRWALDAVAQLVGTSRVSDRDLLRVDHPDVVHVASYVDGLVTAATPLDVREHELRALLRWHEAGRDVRHHPIASPAVVAGVATVLARRGASFSEWDGNLAGRPVPSPAGGAVLSASRLETYASCPLRYFLGNVLHLADDDAPDDIFSIGALDRGSLVHEVLERFIGDVVELPPNERPRPGQPWSAADVQRLEAIAESVFDSYEARGVTGRPVLWRVQRARILDDLHRFVAKDDELRAEHGSTPHAVELAFGFGDAPAAVVELDDGRRLNFRGYIDRVDRCADGSLLVVDYKTGSDKAYRDLEADPVAAGTKLQLPVYALAAAQRFEAPAVTSTYWFATVTGKFARRGYPVDDARLARFRDVLAVIVDGIEQGQFPARPGDFNTFFRTYSNCRYCDFDAVCPRDRGDHWDATSRAPELAPYLELAGLASDDEATA